MKTLYIAIIICGIISAGIIMYFVANLQSESVTGKKSNGTIGLPDYAIGITFNGTTSQDNPLYVKQGQNATLVAQITSHPSNLPASLRVSSHVGFTKTNGIDSRLSDTKTTTPGQVTIYVSATKDATPNTYKVLFQANNTLMTMDSYLYVKVIPSNEIRTVIVNDSRILGPCEIFGIPCPNNPTFTAQMVGSDTYIEKMTINGVDHYAIVRPDGHCVYPPSYNGLETCRSQDDLALIRLVGVDTSIPQENISIAITGLNSTYPVGKPIDFGLGINGFGHCGPMRVLIIHEGNIVWQKTPWTTCPSGMNVISQRYNITELGGPLYLNQSGTYTAHVDYSSNMTERQFNIKSLDDTQTKFSDENPLGITALVEFAPINMNWNSGPNYHFYLKISSNSKAYLLGYDICGNDLCVKNNTLSILMPITKFQIANYTFIGLSDNNKWNYGDTVNIRLEISPTPDKKEAYFLDIKNSTIVP